MSIGSLGIVGSLAATALVQKSSEVDKTQREAADAARKTEAAARAESAEGIGQTEEESQAEERDADGRRLWERPAKKADDDASSELPARNPGEVLAKDPAGISGGTLDLTG